LATGKGIALALELPIVGVGSLEAMASAARSTPAAAYVALLEAGKGECYWAAYDAELACIAGPGHVPLADVASVLAPFANRDAAIVGDVAAPLDAVGLRRVRDAKTDRPRASEIARRAVEKIAARGADDLHALEPVYVRPPDITWPRSTSTTR
jgi:tRNA threonylcarbamoyladenosine biosynthesis protein TsaB